MTSAAVRTREGPLILDSHKLSWHYDRVAAWEVGERIAPVSVDMSLTRACSVMCSFCYAMMQESQARSSIKESHALNLLDDFAEMGIVVAATGEQEPKGWYPMERLTIADSNFGRVAMVAVASYVATEFLFDTTVVQATPALFEPIILWPGFRALMDASFGMASMDGSINGIAY